MAVQYSGADLASLGRLVVTSHQHRPLPLAAFGGKGELEPVRLRPDLVGQPEHGLVRPVVAGEPDDGKVAEVPGESAQVLGIGTAECVDCLRVVAHAGETGAVGT